MQGGLAELCKNKHGRRVILQLLQPNAQKYVPLNVQKMCQSPPKPASGFEVPSDEVQECAGKPFYSHAGYLICMVCQF